MNLHGSYKIDIYNGHNELVESTDYIDNFITSTGLSYIFDTSVANCFKYLSIGSGSSGNAVDTLDLESGDARWSYKNNYIADSCGTIEATTGIQLYRAWLLSGLTGAGYANGLDINEIMVTPSNGGASGKAFSRILPAVNVPSGDYSVITYRLDIAMPTGKKTFVNIIGDNLVNSTEPEEDVCRYWDLATGRYGIVHHGLDTVSSTGETQTPDFGNPMEPSLTDTSYFKTYFSTDYLQFAVNGWSGGAITTGAFQPWNAAGKPLGTGVIDYHYTLDTATKSRLTNARRDSVEHPDDTNIRNESSVTVYQKNNNIVTITPDSYTVTGRDRSVTRLFSWPSVQNQFEDGDGVPRRIKSMVCSYYDGDYLPYADFLFGTTGGEIDPPVDTSAYTLNTGTFGSSTGDYCFIDPFNNMSLSMRISWTAPCPTTVSGCPGYV